MYYFCTYFDSHYLLRGLALYRSLKDRCPSFQLFVLCMDKTCYEILSALNLPSIHLIALEDFEKNDRELLEAKKNRNLIEYYFTCTPSLPLFIFNHWQETNLLTYLDADLFFFADPAPLYDEIAHHSIAIIPHRFSPHLQHHEKNGIYNVGWVSFQRNEHALSCLQWWREKCIEWCYDRVEERRFADQKYLDEFPERFKDVIALAHKGANLAPWNLSNYSIQKDLKDGLRVDNQPLLFFHFHAFRKITNWLYDSNLLVYGVKPSSIVRHSIYSPYIHALIDANKQVAPFTKKEISRSVTKLHRGTFQTLEPFPSSFKTLRNLPEIYRNIISRKYLIVFKEHVL